MERMKMLEPQIIRNLEQTAKFIFVPTNEDEYNQIVELLDEIIVIVRDNENHPLANLMDVLGLLVETYEDQFVPEPESDPISILKHFMEEHHLKQKDLPELGSQGVVSEILNGKRKLTINQIKALSKRFNVPESVFI
jgi:HTH-type transcriptional regulator/antitoxin HigA